MLKTHLLIVNVHLLRLSNHVIGILCINYIDIKLKIDFNNILVFY